MRKAEQLEYLALHNKYNNFQDSQNQFCNMLMEKDIKNLKLEIDKFEQNSEKAEQILKICCIFTTNNFADGLQIKSSRFNHSCEPNAAIIIMLNGSQIRAISNIKAGKEITITYYQDPFSGFRKKEHRQMILEMKWFFRCSCDLCKNGVDIDADASEVLIQEAEKLANDRQSAIEAEISLGPLHYSLEKCKKEVSLYKQLYKIGKTQKIQPYDQYVLLVQGAFDAARFGYQLYKDADLKMDAENFAKAAEKFGKILGNAVVTRGKPNYWKEIYQNYEKWIRNWDHE